MGQGLGVQGDLVFFALAPNLGGLHPPAQDGGLEQRKYTGSGLRKEQYSGAAALLQKFGKNQRCRVRL